ncbi:MAG TPA: ribosomal protein S18-alanine N-acetyltransferase [Arenimonas sp.]|uniref:ribosomal protein S18-alanine N-acetyltransferase n=1 Tax=Arenimonas sp. TaxID=1872635 RepID=UPI002D7E4F09|nr:ribosomal protein S18-alanine N-acetyltransferase [Arenimonas sp.]HEU0152682.1 ribosomal protein S18-alanine N-acetyltransferase [Arenimonas sp.]
MPPALRLRPARATDLPALLALEAMFPGDRLSARQFRHHLASPRARWQVAEEDGRVLGYGLVLLRRGSARGRLYSLVVDPAARGRGLGRRLLQAAERDAAAAGCTGLTLEVRQDNAAANALYRRAGYDPVARLPDYYEDGADGWRYTKPLGLGA